MSEVRAPLFSRVDGVERVQDAVGSWDDGGEVLWAVGACCCCHCGYEVSRYERVIASDYEAERGGRSGETGVNSSQWAFIGTGVSYDVHVECYAEIGYIVILSGSYYQHEFGADHFQRVGYSR